MKKPAPRKKSAKELWGEEQFILADRYMDQRKFKKAFQILLTTVDSGSMVCFMGLGYYYDVGLGCKRDRQKAFYWYKRAVRRGDSAATTNIGTIYRDEKKRHLALYWFKKSLAMGDGDVMLELGKLMLNAYGDKAQAKRYFKALLRRKKYIAESSQEEAAEFLAKL